MPPLKKIATCSYCQARVVFSIGAGSRHELVCSSCGAPLDQTEVLQQPPTSNEAPQRRDERRKPQRRSRDERDKWRGQKSDRDDQSENHSEKKRSSKRRRGLSYRLKKLFDEIEDLFD